MGAERVTEKSRRPYLTNISKYTAPGHREKAYHNAQYMNANRVEHKDEDLVKYMLSIAMYMFTAMSVYVSCQSKSCQSVNFVFN